MDIIYLLGEFPSASEYFILQEMAELEQRGASITILVLSTGAGKTEVPQAAAFMSKVVYYKPGILPALRAHGYSLSVHFSRYLAAWAGIAADIMSGPAIAFRRFRYMHKAVFYIHALRKEKASHVHAHFASAPAAVAAYISAVCGRSYSISAHARDIYVPDKMLAAKMAGASFVVTCTAANKKTLEAIAPGVPLHHIYHGLRLSKWPFAERRPLAAGRPVKLLTVARLVEKKGIIYLLKALKLLKDALPVTATIVGDGPDYKSLLDYVATEGLEDIVRFTGSCPQESLPELYHSCDLFVLPCIIAADGDRDGLPNVLLEALATGIPVITTPVSAIPELIQDRVNGILVHEQDELKIAAAVLTLAEDPALYREIAHNGRRLVEARFDIDRSTDRLYALFDKTAMNGTAH